MPLKMYHRKSDSPEFWETHWKKFLKEVSLEEYCSAHMQNKTLLPIFEKHLPKEGKLIEGGCGIAPWVYVLQKKGYDIEGIDFAEDTINFVKSKYPDLPVRVGNVFNLDYPNDSVRGYISLGVIEHFEEGPQEILKDIYRVLTNGGVLICSVPYFNPLRRIKNKLGMYNHKGHFHQYAFTPRELEDYLNKIGFEVVDVYYYGSIKGLKDEIIMFKLPLTFLGKKIVNINRNIEGVRMKAQNTSIKTDLWRNIIWILRRLYFSQTLCYSVGHMLMMVARAKK